MTRYSVDSEAVIHAAHQARSTIARLQGEVSSLNAQLHSLGASWSGPAASAFHVVHDNWRMTQVRVEESLHTITEALNHAGLHYQEMEISNTRLFQR
jgi:WXG100 family type VII secretion target